MVYGLNVKPEWGFQPKVNWEGEKEPARPIPALNPVNDGGVCGDSFNGGLPVDGSNFPKWVKWRDPNGNPVPDFDKIPYLNVSEKAKRLIESLEPSVHQFFPVEYQDMKGEFRETRYWFVSCNRIDSVDREHTTMVLRKGLEWRPARDMVRRGEEIPSHIDPAQPPRTVFNLKAIGDKHVWVDKHLSGQRYISDAAAKAFANAGLTGIRPSKQESI
jgi:hypothetical protein